MKWRCIILIAELNERTYNVYIPAGQVTKTIFIFIQRVITGIYSILYVTLGTNRLLQTPVISFLPLIITDYPSMIRNHCPNLLLIQLIWKIASKNWFRHHFIRKLRPFIDIFISRDIITYNNNNNDNVAILALCTSISDSLLVRMVLIIIMCPSSCDLS